MQTRDASQYFLSKFHIKAVPGHVLISDKKAHYQHLSKSSYNVDWTTAMPHYMEQQSAK